MFIEKKNCLYTKKADGKRKKSIEVIAFCKLEDTELWFAEIKYINLERKYKKIIVPIEEIRTKAFIKTLRNKGYKMPTDKNEIDQLIEFFKKVNPKKIKTIVYKTGWRKDCYLLPNKSIGDKNKKYIYEKNDLVKVGNYNRKGSLKDWKNSIAKTAESSPLLVFALCASAAAPLLNFVRVESGGFHFTGPSSIGKTTALMVATSFYGRATRNSLPSWRDTDAAIEETALAYNDALFCIDEIGHMAADTRALRKKILTTAFALAAGIGKARSLHYAPKTDATWRTLFISSGEQSLYEIARESGKETLGGEKVRFIEIPALMDEKRGIFETIPKGFSSTEELSSALENSCTENYGKPFRAYIKKLIEKKDKTEAIEKLMNEFMGFNTVDDSGMGRRFAQRFALMYAAGIIAIELRIFPWKKEVVKDAISKCYIRAVNAIPDIKKLVDEGVVIVYEELQNKKKIIKASKKTTVSSEKLAKAVGFERKKNDHYYAIKPESFYKWTGGKIIGSLVMDELNKRGYLLIEKSRGNMLTKQIQISGIKGKKRYVCIKHEFIETSSS